MVVEAAAAAVPRQPGSLVALPGKRQAAMLSLSATTCALPSQGFDSC